MPKVQPSRQNAYQGVYTPGPCIYIDTHTLGWQQLPPSLHTKRWATPKVLPRRQSAQWCSESTPVISAHGTNTLGQAGPGNSGDKKYRTDWDEMRGKTPGKIDNGMIQEG